MEVIERYRGILERVRQAKQKAPHERPVQLVCVSKRQPHDRILELQQAIAADASGERIIIGENYVQEYREKKEVLLPHAAHLIGPLQRNKAKDAVELFDCIESIHSEKLAVAVQKAAEKLRKRIPVLLQVNVSEDEQKSGFLPNEVPEVLSGWKERFPALMLAGGMTITALYDQPESARPDFQRMYRCVDEWFGEFGEKSFSTEAPEVNMGMSSDYEIAVEEGATIIRVGSALFGPRPA